MFLGYNSVIFWPIGLKLFMGIPETIIYRLVMRNYDFDAFLKKDFWRENGLAGLKTRPKSWSNGWNFWVNCYLKKSFRNFRA